MAILFYRPEDQYGCFSNFSDHKVKVYGRVWRTSESAFQSMKFHPHRPDLVKLVWEAATPGRAARLGRSKGPLRPDWDSAPDYTYPDVPQPVDGIYRPGVEPEPLFARTKDVIMYEVCLAKFGNNQELRGILLGTGDEVLIEDANADPYWGWGASRIGENKLGRTLMAVRYMLRTR